MVSFQLNIFDAEYRYEYKLFVWDYTGYIIHNDLSANNLYAYVYSKKFVVLVILMIYNIWQEMLEFHSNFLSSSIS